jgi:sugar-specific transcriptional regulator TrmB/DNA-binding CsgD family transcriptional regulator
VLGALGIDGAEEEVYRTLIGRSSARAVDLAQTMGQTPESVEAVLATLAERGLAARTADGTEFVAAPPAVALATLVRDRRDDLRQAELAVAELAEEHRAVAGNRAVADLIEVVTGVDAVRQRFTQIEHAARREIRAFVTANPIAVTFDESEPHEQAAMGRGVRFRVLMERAALGVPGVVESIVSAPSGQEVRVADSVPIKMMVADRDLALVPLLAEVAGTPAAVVLHRSGLVEALISLFEAKWARAYPLRVVGREVIQDDLPDVDDADLKVLSLLLAGLTDEAVAGQLDMSLRSVQRRVRRLMDLAGVDTRIQLGWHAARAGWA